MKKQIPNILTFIRLFIAFVLFWYKDVNTSFLVLFCIAFVTDLIDGPLARALGCTSEFGAKMDSAADTLLYVTIARILLSNDKLEPIYVKIAGWALMAILISAFIGQYRFGSFFFIHTISGKLLGLSCFLMPFASMLNLLDYLVPVICFILIVLAVESLIIQLKADKPDPDMKSAFCLLSQKKKA